MNVRVAMRMEKAIPPLVRAMASIAKYIIKPPMHVANRTNSIVVFKRSSMVILKVRGERFELSMPI